MVAMGSSRKLIEELIRLAINIFCVLLRASKKVERVRSIYLFIWKEQLIQFNGWQKPELFSNRIIVSILFNHRRLKIISISDVFSKASVCQSRVLWTWFDEWISLLFAG